jgi:LmbE family N-acetylglucosaminyl deacetylase
MVKVRNEVRPDWVLMPSSQSIHQDHKVIFEEGLRAFKFTTCLGYDLPWDYVTFTNNYLIPLEERHIGQKVAALKAYASQTFRFYADEGFIYGLARTRGVQCQSAYAEAFEAIKIIHRP